MRERERENPHRDPEGALKWKHLVTDRNGPPRSGDEEGLSHRGIWEAKNSNILFFSVDGSGEVPRGLLGAPRVRRRWSPFGAWPEAPAGRGPVSSFKKRANRGLVSYRRVS